MILDKLENSSIYFPLNSRFEKAFAFLAENKLEELIDGRYEIDGEDLFAVVMSYKTHPIEQVEWEAHKKYLDIQYVVKGKEIMGWTPENQLKTLKPYSDEKDVVFFNETTSWTEANMYDSYFAIVYPSDAHKPGCILREPTIVKKVVVKVRL